VDVSSPLKECLDISNGEMLSVDDLIDAFLLIPFTGSGVDVFAVKKLLMFGQGYYVGMSLLMDIDENGDPTFAFVDHMYVHCEMHILLSDFGMYINSHFTFEHMGVL